MIPIGKQHAEWLSLIDINGPFLTVDVLMQAFPQGLDGLDTEIVRRTRSAYLEWEDNLQQRHPDQSVHRAWIEFVLKSLLEYGDNVLLEGQAIPEAIKCEVAEHGETLRPDIVLSNPPGRLESGKTRMLIKTYPANQGLEKPIEKSRWKTSPATRMRTLLQATKVPLGLVTNGRQWMLVNMTAEQSEGFITWYANLWIEERATFQAFISLLHARRFFGVAEAQTIEALLRDSAKNKQEVTDRLGYQVRRAIEVFIQTIDRIDKDRNRALLAGVGEKKLYEAALTVMMRLVFLYSAEEKELLLLGDEIYDRHYAISTLGLKLREEADQLGEEVLERRNDAWARLLATFRAVHGGIEHDRLRLAAYGGSLFDPDRFPFLEGRERGTQWRESEALPLPIDNRTVLHLLEALQFLEMKVPGGYETRRLSFRSLDVEQIGHVYEGLLDHTAKRAKSSVVGLIGAKNLEPEVELEELERKHSEGVLIEYLREVTQRSESAIKKALSADSNNVEPLMLHRLLTACDNDEVLRDRVLPFLGLLRADTHGLPVVITAGSVYVTDGDDRRTTGTHYTPRTLTEPIVQYTLEPLVYKGVAEGKPKNEWRLATAGEILKLKVCDMAMGSGAFLVQTCRYLSERLVEAWDEVETANPGKVVIAPDGALSDARPDECLIPREAEERLIVARRIIADRCLYGVDVNPMAVEMAKLSLWLVTLQKDRPFTFLDHALRCGDSLLGVTDLAQIAYFNLKTGEGTQIPFAAPYLKEQLGIVQARRQELESFTVNDIVDLERKQRMLAEAEEALERVRLFGDLLIGDSLRLSNSKGGRYSTRSVSDGADDDDSRSEIEDKIIRVFSFLNEARFMETEDLRAKAETLLGKRKPFHWALEFPEVFSQLEPPTQRSGLSTQHYFGFDAIVGNPPFIGGKKITGALGTDYRNFLVEYLADGQKGVADLSAYFFLRAKSLLRVGGSFGLVATNTIAQGDTREVGLDQITTNNGIIYRAVPSIPWPGEASLEVAYIWLRNGTDWRGEYVLTEKQVNGITPYLGSSTRVSGRPIRLAANADIAFIGSIILGMGFILTPEEVSVLTARDARNSEVLFPYLIGEDVNSRPDQSPSRWVINFQNMPCDHESVPQIYKGVAASDYQECFQIVKDKVKPFRDQNKKKIYREKWWQFGERCPGLYSSIKGMKRVLVIAIVSRTVAFTFVPTSQVFAHKLAVFAFDNDRYFSVLQSSIHYFWAWQYSSTMKSDLNYSPSDCFETFPFPKSLDYLEEIGGLYDTYRRSVMGKRQEGLTKTYNRFHDSTEKSEDIQKLRSLHIEMDQQVAKAYGWDDLDLGHDFHQTKQGLRFTISEAARVEVLDRLLALNHKRYEEEVRQGLHEKGRKKKGAGKKRDSKAANNPDEGEGDPRQQAALFE